MRHAELRKFPLPPARVRQFSGAAPVRLCPPPEMGEGEGGGHLSPVVSAGSHVYTGRSPAPNWRGN